MTNKIRSEPVLEGIVNTYPVMQMDDIREKVFSFLDLESLKTCRLVNSSWNFLANKFVRRSSKIVFKFTHHNYNQKRRQEICEKMESIGRAFVLVNRQPMYTPFGTFEFKGMIPIDLFVNFMKENGSCIRELRIFGAIEDVNNPDRKEYDLSPVLDPSLRMLSINWNLTPFKYLISLKSISFIEELDIGNCSIILDGGEVHISLVKLVLTDGVRFLQNGVELKSFVLNEIFDFTQSRTICLENPFVILDFSLCVDYSFRSKILRNVTLINAKVRNWERCNWRVNVLSLSNVDFMSKNKMDIHELKCNEGKVDLCVIHNPKAIRNISLYNGTKLQNRKSYFFPNIKDLCLANECLHLLPYFSQNSTIKRVHLAFDKVGRMDQVTINVKDLPEKVEIIQIEEVKIAGDEPYTVDQLFLSDYEEIEQFQLALTKFKPQSVYLVDFDILDFDIDGIIDFVRKPKPFKFLTIGSFDWAEYSFSDSKFSDLVNRKADTYTFISQRKLSGQEDMFCFDDVLGIPAPRRVVKHLRALELID